MRWRPSPVTAFLVTIAVGLAGNLAANTVQVTALWWRPAVWTAVCLLVVAAAVIEWARTQPADPRSVSGLDELADYLAGAVKATCRREEDHRRVQDPVVLPVRWRPAADQLVDQWANIRHLPVGASAGPMALAGRIEEVADVYRRITSGRLVILGKTGAGKSVLATRLTLDLLTARQPGQPVPVIASLGSRDPTTTRLTSWLASQLVRDYPGLGGGAQAGGSTWASILIAAGRIVPI